MKEKDKKFVKSWEASRKAGFAKYVISHGLVFGLLLFLATSLYHLLHNSFSEVFLSRQTLYSLLIWLLGGIAGYGPVSWWINEYLYRQRTRPGSNRNP